MSIASELQNLNDKILDAYDAVNDKGGTIPSAKNMANLVSAIGSIPTGGGSVTVTPLSVTQNGIYTAPTGTAYSPVTVDVSDPTVETGEIPLSSSSTSSIVIPHSLGEIPAFFVLLYSAWFFVGSNIIVTATKNYQGGGRMVSGFLTADFNFGNTTNVSQGNSVTDGLTYVTMDAANITMTTDLINKIKDRVVGDNSYKAFWMATTKAMIPA